MFAKKSAPSDQSPVLPSTVTLPELGWAAITVGTMTSEMARTPAAIIAAERVDARIRRPVNPRIRTSLGIRAWPGCWLSRPGSPWSDSDEYRVHDGSATPRGLVRIGH